jgi:hypothetical protein
MLRNALVYYREPTFVGLSVDDQARLLYVLALTVITIAIPIMCWGYSPAIYKELVVESQKGTL